MPTQSGRGVADDSPRTTQSGKQYRPSGNLVHRREKAAHRAALRSAACLGPKWPAFSTFRGDADVWLASPRKARSVSIQRFHLDDGCTVIVADPERPRALRIVDVDTPNIGRVRQLIFRVLAAL